MSYLNASSLKLLIDSKKVVIEPYVEKFQGPNMYYCHLGSNLLIPKGGLADTADLSDDLYEHVSIHEYYDLEPGKFILAETYESFTTDTAHAFRIFNSSSLARLGVSQCAVGMINPGCGVSSPIRVTLELVNNGPFTVRLYPTTENKDKKGISNWGTEVLKVALITYEDTDQAYEEWNGSLYGSDKGVRGSLIDRRFK